MSQQYRARGAGRGRGSEAVPFHSRGRGDGGFRGGRGDGGFRGGRGDGRGARGGRGGPVEIQVYSQQGGIPPVDKSVVRIEDDTAVKAKQASQKSKALLPSHPQRPGFGVMGKPVVLWTNYFKLDADDDLLLHRYSVEIRAQGKANVPTGKKAGRVVQLFMEEHMYPNGIDVATDFKSNLISRSEIDVEDDGYPVAYKAENEDDPAPGASQFTIHLQSTGTFTASELIQHLSSSQAGLSFSSKEEIIQALNIVLGHHPKAAPDMTSVGANRHFPRNPGNQDMVSLGAGLQAIRGLFLSVRAATARILVNLQVKPMAFCDEGPVDMLMQTYMHENGPNPAKLLKFLRALSIDVTHIERRNKTGVRIPRIKTIRGFASTDDGRKLDHPPRVAKFGATPKEVEFFLGSTSEATGAASQPSAGATVSGQGKRGKKAKKQGPAPPPTQGHYISVFDFFKQTYNITCNPSLPVVNVGSRDNPSYLPPQVCHVTPGQPARAKLTPQQTREMLKFAVRYPWLNAQTIGMSGGQLLGFEPTNPTLNAFDIKVTPKLLTVPGRVLDSPTITYAKSMETPRFGSWNMQSAQFVTQSKLPKWTYLRIGLQGAYDPWRTEVDFHSTMDRFQTLLGRLGLTGLQYMRGQHIIADQRNLESAIDVAVGKFTRVSDNRPTLILVVVPERESTLVYNRVKYVCDVKEGLVNVCVLASKFHNANDQYFANVGLKFNLKLGGCNHALEPSKLGILKEKKTMVVGIDVTHPAPGSSSNAPSVAGIVASRDPWLGQWPAELRIQPAQQEMVEGLDSMFKTRLRLWQQFNGNSLPDNVLVYRDGVSEGQYDIVLQDELPALQKACRELYPATMTKEGKPRITVVIVGKRHHTRFYATRKEDTDRSGNTRNGTIVDRGVTQARNWDFFLQAHAAIKGTAKPAHYYIIYDEIFRAQKQQPSASFKSAADALEDLTHNLCYLFGRATKAVSICPPAYYADLVCERARCYLSSYFNPSPGPSAAGSIAGTSTEGSTLLPDASSVNIHPRVQNTMFYI